MLKTSKHLVCVGVLGGGQADNQLLRVSGSGIPNRRLNNFRESNLKRFYFLKNTRKPWLFTSDKQKQPLKVDFLASLPIILLETKIERL